MGSAAVEMQQIRYFLAVCETLNFTRAAEACNVSQPSLTRAIKALEEELGGPLFRRERNNTHLTGLGDMMRPHLSQVLVETEAAKDRARSFGRLEDVELEVRDARAAPSGRIASCRSCRASANAIPRCGWPCRT